MRRCLTTGVALVCAGLVGCGVNGVNTAVSTETKPKTLQHPSLYNAADPFKQRLAADAAVDPNSAALVESLLASAQQAFVVAWRRWSCPVYFATTATPRADVALTADWAPKKKLNSVPLPSYAEPDPESDGHLCVIDLANGCEYDLWQARKVGGAWSASWANVIEISGNGVFAQGYSARGSGFALPQGLIWPDELAAGRIDHALALTYDYIKAGGPVPPATESDGESTRADAIPEGARLRLDPRLDLDALGLQPYQKTIAQAMQDYGLIVVDSGGGVQLNAISPLSVDGSPYAGLLPDEDYPDLSAIPLDQVLVLTLPAQNADVMPALVPTGCALFE